VDRFLYSMRLNDDQLRDVSARLLREMQKGLSRQSSATAAVKMLPTHVCSTPDGSGDPPPRRGKNKQPPASPVATDAHHFFLFFFCVASAHSLCSCRSRSALARPLDWDPGAAASPPPPGLPGSEALMSRVMLRTPCWMMSSSVRWISRTDAVSGNMSMKR
ncbi:hypothetical protein CRUP_030388, partial [Coryphaenoides rupestris]